MSTTPDPNTPDPITPDPISPDPVTPDQVAPEPVTAAPTIPDGPTAEAAPSSSRPSPDLRPIYAVAGLTDVLVGAVRSTISETQHWASARMAELRFRQAELEKQAAELRERADVLPDQVRTLPEITRTRVSGLQQQPTSTYADLAGRGQRIVQGVAGRVDPVFDRVQEGVNAARRIVTGRTGAGPATGAAVAEPVVAADVAAADLGATDVPGSDDPLGTPAGVPDEALVAEDVILVEGVEAGSLEPDEVQETTDGTATGPLSDR